MQPNDDNSDENCDYLHWMIKSRAEASELLYKVHQFGRDLHGDHPETYRASFENLVGAAFSLWRAAFLALEPTKKRNSLDAAKDVLEELLKHNRIGYEQEKSLFAWFCRFYLKSAEMRIVRAAELLNVDPKQDEALQQVIRRVKEQTTASGENPQDRWDDAYPAADFLVVKFHKEFQRMYPKGGGDGSKEIPNSDVSPD